MHHASLATSLCTTQPLSSPLPSSSPLSPPLPHQVRVRLHMQDTLRDLALDSMAKFLDLIRSACPPNPIVKSTAAVELGDAICSSQPAVAAAAAARRSAPLLVTELVVTPDGQHLAYGTAPEVVHAHMLALFDRGLQRMQVGGGTSAVGASEHVAPFPL